MPGALFASPMPGFGVWPLEAAFRAVSEARVDRVICLEEEEALLDRSPAYWRAIRTGESPAPITRVDVPDFGLPADEDAYLALVREIAAAVRAGERVLVHCAGGCGRTGTFASLVLVALGMGPDDAEATFRAARGCGPEGAAQKAFVRRAAEHVGPAR